MRTEEPYQALPFPVFATQSSSALVSVRRVRTLRRVWCGYPMPQCGERGARKWHVRSSRNPSMGHITRTGDTGHKALMNALCQLATLRRPIVTGNESTPKGGGENVHINLGMY
eukprot:COSAG02_NODE_969_length_15565_cov_9.614833_1_plen_113_part_00